HCFPRRAVAFHFSVSESCSCVEGTWPAAHDWLKVLSTAVFSELHCLKNLKFEYKYLSYFQGNPIQVTICVTGTCACHPLKWAPFLRRVRATRTFVLSRTRRLGYVSKTGRPSRQREDHHPRTTATGDQGAEGTKLPPGQCTGQTQLPYGRGCHQFPLAPVRRSRNKSFLF